MARQRLLNNSSVLVLLSAVLSVSTVALHFLAMLGMSPVGFRDLVRLLWLMPFAAVLCSITALWVLRRRKKKALPRPSLGLGVAGFCLCLGLVLTLVESFLAYVNSFPER